MSAPSPDTCVLRNLVDRQASEYPDRTFALFEDGEIWTYGNLADQVRSTGAALQKLGVAQGDTVLVWLPNSAKALQVLFAINYIGAICAPISINLKGKPLEHILVSSGARLLIADGRVLDRMDDLVTGSLEAIVTIGAPNSDKTSLNLLPEARLRCDAVELMPPARTIQPWDTQCILFTSGTTGPSKGVLSTYLHRFEHATAVPEINANDRRLIHSPLSHTGGFGSAFAMLILGGSLILVESFRTTTFWGNVKRFKATVTSLLGATIPFLLSLPSREGENAHGLKLVLVAPVDQHAMTFSRRYEVPVQGVYSMTEISIPLICHPPFDRMGQCGFPRPGYELRIADEADFEVEKGKIGQLIIRSDKPWTMTQGYLNNPEASLKAWRNGWFHTGDLFMQDEDGQYIYSGRTSDSIRRRGENISAFELENEIIQYPGIREVGVIGVPSEYSEEDVLAVIAVKDDDNFEPAQLIAFLHPRLPHYMIPRYIRVIDSLPHTNTQKIDKPLLRAEGVVAGTWDAQAHGIQIKREKLE